MPSVLEFRRNAIGCVGSFVRIAVTDKHELLFNDARAPGMALARKLIEARYFSSVSGSDVIAAARDLTGSTVRDGDLMGAQDAVDRWAGELRIANGLASGHFRLPFPGFEGTWVEASVDIALEECKAGLAIDQELDIDYEGLMRDFGKLYTMEFEKFLASLSGVHEGLSFGFVFFRDGEIYAKADAALFKRFFALSRLDGHRVFSRVLKEECGSHIRYGGYYTPDPECYIRKDTRLWDHNELTWLTMAASEICGREWEDIAEHLEGLLQERVREICLARISRTRRA